MLWTNNENINVIFFNVKAKKKTITNFKFFLFIQNYKRHEKNHKS